MYRGRYINFLMYRNGWCIATETLRNARTGVPQGAMSTEIMMLHAPWVVVAAYVLFEGCFVMITHQNTHKFAFLGSYTQHQQFDVSFSWCIAAIQRWYIRFLMYRLPSRAHTTLMYRLGDTSRYITIQRYSDTARYIKSADVSPSFWKISFC